MAATVTPLTRRHHRHLAPEPWGARLARARESSTGTQRQTAQLLRGLRGYSYGTIQRLEKLTEPPTDETQRGRAMVLCLIYGYDPAEFGLRDDDFPPFIDPAAVMALTPDQGIASSRCSTLSLVA